ncbi:hypothetical protein BW723_12385 [Polaribacter reichenbachii]|uniref:Uncharacterized protein n=1 Tax=Polaribacter reichenbachii TaxID=996801 RepID=A0A1B8U0A1_9FLAO|nr:hypothetical protein [Polaribacter reichenbachii]APZ47032.1 hypothetical protein BW723_12385 [Polaribacter reichenbachii]AUC17674.1 hypothetical protein BTO17_02835 [Polaribacter reichenbachii]OBY65304.1 hypothetical protein LPB301_09385 [Polaribacter reichenbachii]
MKFLLTLNLIFLISFSLFSQKYSFKKNGYYYTKTKTATSDFISTNWNKNLQSKGYVFGVEAILFKENKEISVSDYFYGLFHSKKNNYEASIDFLETYLTFNSNLKSKSNYTIKDSIITFKIFPFTKPTIKKNEIKSIIYSGKYIDENNFTLTSKNTYNYNNQLIKSIEISKKYIFKPFVIKREKFYNDDLKEISFQDYKKLAEDNSNILFNETNDSLIFKMAFKKIKTGRFNVNEFDKIKNRIENITNNPIDKDKTIILNFINLSCDCPNNEHLTHFKKRYKKYLKKIDKKDNIQQLFITIRTSNLNIGINYFNDNDSYLTKTLYKKIRSNAFVIIKPNGNYYLEREGYNFNLNKILEKI